MVTIHPCNSYQADEVQRALTAAIADIGGFEPYIQPGESVLLKAYGCGDCAANCPAKVIVMKNRRPTVDYHKCISVIAARSFARRMRFG